MKKNFFILLILFLFQIAFGQVGIGAGGGLLYPGFQESDLYKSRFIVGGGFEIFARHNLLKINESVMLDARYAYRNYFSDVDLPFTENTRFIFNYLSAEVFTVIKRFERWQFYGGGGFSLVSINASKDFFESIESIVMPELFIGIEVLFGRHYNLFGEFLFQHGSVGAREDILQLTGVRFMLGGTMYFTE